MPDKIAPKLFSINPPQKPPTGGPPPVDPIGEDAGKRGETYQVNGFKQAGRLGGSNAGLKVCLARIQHDHRQTVREDKARQDQLMRPYREKLNSHEHDVERLLQEIEGIKGHRLPKLHERIDVLKREISDIRQDPKAHIGHDSGKAGFIIGLIILLFLTLYLFVFYSSASYSAFFKTFEITNIGVANSIFDPQAISKALSEGVTELVLILTIPFVFLGLGYLIHKIQEATGWTKYLRIGLLVLVTFLFDAILAYEITHKIHEIKQQGSFIAQPDYTVEMAMRNVQFWMIIFAGFVVYLIWGFVFDIVMEAHGKLDAVSVAIRERRSKIVDTEHAIAKLEAENLRKEEEIASHKKEVAKLKKFIDGGHVITDDFEQSVFQFAQGWMAWMKQSGMAKDDLDRADEVVHGFVRITFGSDTSEYPVG